MPATQEVRGQRSEVRQGAPLTARTASPVSAEQLCLSKMSQQRQELIGWFEVEDDWSLTTDRFLAIFVVLGSRDSGSRN